MLNVLRFAFYISRLTSHFLRFTSHFSRLLYKTNSKLLSVRPRNLLLRKEVIHPHLPVRIPCYDLTPIINPTLDGSLHCWLGHRFWVLLTFVVWRAVCTNPENVFTATFWFAITSDSDFMKSSCRLQSELRHTFWDSLHITISLPSVYAIVVRV